MGSILRMPGISADSEEATLLEWLLDEGQEVGADDAVVTVETDKAEVDITPDRDGIVWRRLAEAGKSVAVGAPIAVLLDPGESDEVGERLLASIAESVPATQTPGDAPPPPSTTDAPVESDGPVGAAQPAMSPPKELVGRRRRFASPLARRVARERGVDLSVIAGSGPGGRILRQDVERADTPWAEPVQRGPESRGAEPDDGAGYVDVPHSSLRRAVASRLAVSKQESPHFYLEATCWVDALLDLRRQVNAGSSMKVSINDLVVKAAACALRDVPEMNVSWTTDAVRHYEQVDVAVAVASERGLMTPVVRGADQLSLSELASTIRDLADRAGAGALKQHELEGGSFTVTNLGMFGVERFAAVINPPHAGILAVGAVVKQPVVVDDLVEVASTMGVTVSADHRPVDGIVAARWLQRFKELIESPAAMLA